VREGSYNTFLQDSNSNQVAKFSQDKGMARSVMAKNYAIDEYIIPDRGLLDKQAHHVNFKKYN